MNKENKENIAMMKKWLEDWSLKSIDASKILRVHKSKMSEYLRGVRKIPPYICSHINTLIEITGTKYENKIKKTLEKKPKGN